LARRLARVSAPRFVRRRLAAALVRDVGAPAVADGAEGLAAAVLAAAVATAAGCACVAVACCGRALAPFPDFAPPWDFVPVASLVVPEVDRVVGAAVVLDWRLRPDVFFFTRPFAGAVLRVEADGAFEPSGFFPLAAGTEARVRAIRASAATEREFRRALGGVRPMCLQSVVLPLESSAQPRF
jgi:hypothetical protein